MYSYINIHYFTPDSFISFLSGLAMTETGLPGLLFGLLDSETDRILVQHVHHTLTSMLQALATSHLGLWLTLCREVLTSASGMIILCSRD